MALSATRAKALKDPGRYSDGGGLHLYISKAGTQILGTAHNHRRTPTGYRPGRISLG